MTKSECLQHALVQLQEKIATLTSDINDLSQGIAADSKSSAGDKFETAREMSQQELNKLSVQLNENQRFLSQVRNFYEVGNAAQIGQGSVVQVGELIVIIGLPVGRIAAPFNLIGIGTTAPLSQLIIGKKNNEVIQWQGNAITLVLID